MNTPGYESLANVLQRAYDQAAKGKGHERHATNLPFDQQPMQSISALLGNSTGLAYQAVKKIQESQRMDKDAAVRELLGAINYLAGHIIFLESDQGQLDFGPTRILSPEQSRVAGENLRKQNLYDKAVEKHNGAWICRHAGAEVPFSTVPIGEACPVCFATK